MGMVDEAEELGPEPSIADLAVEEAVDQLVRIMEPLTPADREQALDQLALAIRVLRGPKYLPRQIQPVAHRRKHRR
jgi:hypothetical protein